MCKVASYVKYLEDSPALPLFKVGEQGWKKASLSTRKSLPLCCYYHAIVCLSLIPTQAVCYSGAYLK